MSNCLMIFKTKTSLLSKKCFLIKQDKSIMEQYKFKRIPDIIHNLKIITPDLSCQDIRQGALGNCYFMSAISAVAEVPDRIKRNFLQKDLSEKGAYCIALNILGSWTPVIIDDIFAVDEHNRLSFSKAKDDRI